MSTIIPGVVLQTTLEVGQGPSGPPGPAGPASGSGAEYPAAVAVSGHRVVALDEAGEVFAASADTLSHALRVAGVTLGAAAEGEPVTVQSIGPVEFSGWAFTPGQPVFLGLAGALVQSLPPGAVFSLVIGTALSATRVAVRLQPPIVLT